MRKTKIVCTIGPASSDRAVFADMCRAGMNVARLNFSHGTHEEQKAKLDMIRSVREELGLPIAILLDTKGPEYRIRTFRNGKITLNDGDTFTFTTRDIEGDEGIVSVSYKGPRAGDAPGRQDPRQQRPRHLRGARRRGRGHTAVSRSAANCPTGRA